MDERKPFQIGRRPIIAAAIGGSLALLAYPTLAQMANSAPVIRFGLDVLAWRDRGVRAELNDLLADIDSAFIAEINYYQGHENFPNLSLFYPGPLFQSQNYIVHKQDYVPLIQQTLILTLLKSRVQALFENKGLIDSLNSPVLIRDTIKAVYQDLVANEQWYQTGRTAYDLQNMLNFWNSRPVITKPGGEIQGNDPYPGSQQAIENAVQILKQRLPKLPQISVNHNSDALAIYDANNDQIMVAGAAPDLGAIYSFFEAGKAPTDVLLAISLQLIGHELGHALDIFGNHKSLTAMQIGLKNLPDIEQKRFAAALESMRRFFSLRLKYGDRVTALLPKDQVFSEDELINRLNRTITIEFINGQYDLPIGKHLFMYSEPDENATFESELKILQNDPLGKFLIDNYLSEYKDIWFDLVLFKRISQRHASIVASEYAVLKLLTLNHYPNPDHLPPDVEDSATLFPVTYGSEHLAEYFGTYLWLTSDVGYKPENSQDLVNLLKQYPSIQYYDAVIKAMGGKLFSQLLREMVAEFGQSNPELANVVDRININKIQKHLVSV